MVTRRKQKSNPPSREKTSSASSAHPEDHSSNKNKRFKKTTTSTTTTKTVEQVYDDCFSEDDATLRHAAWSNYVDQGVLPEVIWPAILRDYKKMMMALQSSTETKSPKQQEQSHRGDVRAHAFPLVALLASVAHTQGQSPLQIIDGILVDEVEEGDQVREEEENEGNEKKTSSKGSSFPTSDSNNSNSMSLLWKDCLTTICHCHNLQTIHRTENSSSSSSSSSNSIIDWEYLGAVTHFFGLLLYLHVGLGVDGACGQEEQASKSANAGNATSSQQQQKSKSIWMIIKGWRSVVMGEEGEKVVQVVDDTTTTTICYALWDHLPPMQREFLFRKHGITVESHQEKQHLPFLVVLVHHILSLMASDDLKIRFHQRQEGGGGDDDDDDDDENADNEGRTSETSPSTTKALKKTAQWVFLHRALELLLDLLEHPLYRPSVAPFLTALHVGIHCRRALGVPSNVSRERVDANMYLAQQLVARLERSLRSNPTTTATLTTTPSASTTTSTTELYHRRAITLQKMCHWLFPDIMQDLIYAGAGTICQDVQFLRSAVAALDNHQFIELLCKMRLLSKENNHAHERDFLQAVLEDYVLFVPALNDPLQELQSTPLYATESILWDFSRIPPSLSSLLPVSQVLSLPKLHAQFVSFSSYLATNFELTQASSAYDIRVDLVDVLRRVRPLLRQQVDDDDVDNKVVVKTEFTGWARMALEVAKVEIVRVQKPLWGEPHPAQVVAEITIDLKPCGDAIRREWDELGEFDNLFMLAVDASKQSGQPAPSLRDYHLQHGSRVMDTDQNWRVPDEDDRTFPQRYGVTLVRGCMILHVRDEGGNILSDPSTRKTPTGTKRIFRVALDPAQYTADFNSPAGTSLYQSINLVVRRHGRENNFKSELETIRGLMAGAGAINQVLPTWLQPVLLGHGNPSAAHYKSKRMQQFARTTAGVAKPEDPLDFGDTFVDESHLRSSFGDGKVIVDGRDALEDSVEPQSRRNYRIRTIEKDGFITVEASSYAFREGVKGNAVAFTPAQVEAIRSGLSPGLTTVIGPPGTGKTDVAVQIISCLYHSFPTQRTIVITHSNAALNDIFSKVMARGDVEERYLVRLGGGERDLETDSSHDFTKAGRVEYSLHRRGILLEEIQQLSESLGISTKRDRGDDGSPSYTCETAEYFHRHHVLKRVREFNRQMKSRAEAESRGGDFNVGDIFPFMSYFHIGTGEELSRQKAFNLLNKLNAIFQELAEYRPLELLRSQRQRTDYLLMKQARVVAMTCTHAAIARSHLIDLGFHYDNVVVEEAGQMTEIESFIPFLLQREDAGASSSSSSSSTSRNARLKRICLIGDHNQLPPVIKNMTFAHYCDLDQSMFARLIRLGVSHVQLDKQGRARPEIASLYSWRYDNLGNLDAVIDKGEYRHANAGFVHTFQLIDVDKFQGRGEQTPTAYFYQNAGEAEYAVALFQYMVLIGYSPRKISILTTYNGQKALISDILAQRCGEGTPLAGVRPRAVSTVDQYQGQQNDFIILSLVRTESVGHLRDVRRLVVAVSRSRLGLYVLCRQQLFASCHDLKKTFDQFTAEERGPTKLQLVLNENYPTERCPADEIPPNTILEIDDVTHLGSIVFQMQEQLMKTDDS